MTLFLLILACSAGILLVLWYIYRTAFYNPPSMRGTIDDPMKGDQYEDVAEHIYRISHIMEKASCEEIQITSFDGCKLFGRYYHLRDGAPLEILFHGYRSCSFRDCSGGHLLSRKMGFNALVIDQRAHGKSSGNTITFDCYGDDYGIMTSGGTIQNITVEDVARGIVSMYPNQDVILKNVVSKEKVLYPFNTTEHPKVSGVDFIAIDCTFGGWMSFAGFDIRFRVNGSKLTVCEIIKIQPEED